MSSVQDEIFNNFELRVLRLSLCTRGVPEKQVFYGNAFVVYYREGLCLFMTCDHCLEEEDLKENQYYRLDFSKSYLPGFEVHVAFRDKARDLALLQANHLQQVLEHLIINENDDITCGSDVALLAFYAKEGSVLDEPGVMLGTIVGLPDTTKTSLELIRANYTAKTGAAGSPVISVKSMCVVGVHSEGELAAKYAVSAQSIKAALQIWSESEEGDVIDQMLHKITLLTCIRDRSNCR